MLDVHPPHEPIHGWRDFLLHILTITIGLLIALTLEAAVERLHHRHIVAEARENIRHEIEDNQKLIAGDHKSIDEDSRQMRVNMAVLRTLRQNPHSHGSMSLSWSWSAPNASAWSAARDTGALALMPYAAAQSYADLYGQQQLVNEQAILLFRNQTKASVPMMIEADSATPAQIDEALHRCAETIVDLAVLNDFLKGLDQSYEAALKSSRTAPPVN